MGPGRLALYHSFPARGSPPLPARESPPCTPWQFSAGGLSRVKRSASLVGDERNVGAFVPFFYCGCCCPAACSWLLHARCCCCCCTLGLCMLVAFISCWPCIAICIVCNAAPAPLAPHEGVQVCTDDVHVLHCAACRSLDLLCKICNLVACAWSGCCCVRFCSAFTLRCAIAGAAACPCAFALLRGCLRCFCCAAFH